MGWQVPHVLAVELEQVAGLAATLDDVGEGLDRVAQGAARAWERVGEASPQLRAAAAEVAGRWSTDLRVGGGLTQELAAATRAAVADYRRVEQAVAHAFLARSVMAGRAPGVAP